MPDESEDEDDEDREIDMSKLPAVVRHSSVIDG